MTKDQNDIRLLDKSIAHWKRMRAWTLKQWKEYALDRAYPEEPSPSHCALCIEYFPTCKNGCPVCGYNEHPFCEGTPYIEADSRFVELEGSIRLHEDEQRIETEHKSWRHAAQQEIAFLTKLRDELKKKVACQARHASRKVCQSHGKCDSAVVAQKCP